MALTCYTLLPLPATSAASHISLLLAYVTSQICNIRNDVHDKVATQTDRVLQNPALTCHFVPSLGSDTFLSMFSHIQRTMAGVTRLICTWRSLIMTAPLALFLLVVAKGAVGTFGGRTQAWPFHTDMARLRV
jgi:hypothetical protein